MPKSGTNFVQKILENHGYKYSGLGIAETLVRGNYSVIRRILRGSLFNLDCYCIGLSVPTKISKRFINNEIKNLDGGEYFTGHMNYVNEVLRVCKANNVIVIQVMREPFDTFLSWVSYTFERPDIYLNSDFNPEDTFEERAKIVLNGYSLKNGDTVNGFPLVY